MIIISQDNRNILNFDFTQRIGLDRETNFSSIVAYQNGNAEAECLWLGSYKTEKRAKEVLNAIGAYYGLCEIYKYGEQSDREQINNYAAERGVEPFIFPMPEE